MAKHKDELLAFEEDYLVFEEEPEEISEVGSDDVWKVLIVDDEQSVHDITRLELSDFTYLGRKISLLSAYSEKEALEMLNENDDISLVLLDVVMDHEDSGLKLVRYIRERLYNRIMRIILRTGQPGQAPERQVIMNYDINDYKLKTDLTSNKLFVAVVSALRSYDDINNLEKNGRGLEKIIDTSLTIFHERKIAGFTQMIPRLFMEIFNAFNISSAAICGISASLRDGQYVVDDAYGQYDGMEGKDLTSAVDRATYDFIIRADTDGVNQFREQELAVCFKVETYRNLIYLRMPHTLSKWEVNLMNIFMTNASVYHRNLYLVDEMEAAQREIIYLLGEVAEARSEEMGNHVKRVADYSHLMAILYGLNQKEAEMIAVASPVHDIGKLAIPDQILNKPGRLTKDEFEEMKKHAGIGYEMLKNSHYEMIKMAAAIAKTHHEYWNGKGYPDGLKGEAIPLVGRIVAFADVFDALGESRVYKNAWDMEEVVSYIQSERGEHFEPLIVDLFVEHLEMFLEIKERYNHET